MSYRGLFATGCASPWLTAKERSFSGEEGSPNSIAIGPASPQVGSNDIENNTPEKSVSPPIAEKLFLTHAENQLKQRKGEKKKKAAIEFILNIAGLALLFIQAATSIKSSQDAHRAQHRESFSVLNFLFALSTALSFVSAVGLKTYFWERHLKDSKRSIQIYRNNKDNHSSDALLRYLPLKLKEEIAKLPNMTTEELNELLPRMLGYFIDLHFNGQTLDEVDGELERLFAQIEQNQSEFNWLKLIAPITLGASTLALITQLNLTFLEKNNLNSILAIASLFLLILATSLPFRIENSNTNLPSYLKTASDKIIERETQANAAISTLQYHLTNQTAGITLFNHHANFFRLAIAEDNYRSELSNIAPMFKRLQEILTDNRNMIIRQSHDNEARIGLLLSADLANPNSSLDDIQETLNALTKTLQKVGNSQSIKDLFDSVENFQRVTKNDKLQLRKKAYNDSVHVSANNAQHTLRGF